ncbi:hypothetical protein MTF65_13940 [Streptomyces sp. APSN-46.1]|uniref:hypothetical protein n=1 Tax=Streptomyces sp. APSN-46.1 TaxID=2929049 RepID=UPI001FB1FD67|nr:hypothetical protein [Streptomyces sp. APSN-46.1]MCJ1678430.1 hypothetical protein [Streptomyces sp. APSN-46.1]
MTFVVIDGKIGGDSWVYEFGSGKLIETYTEAPKKKAAPTAAVADGAKRVVPQGGVKAGAEGVAPKNDARCWWPPAVAWRRSARPGWASPSSAAPAPDPAGPLPGRCRAAARSSNAEP